MKLRGLCAGGKNAAKRKREKEEESEVVKRGCE